MKNFFKVLLLAHIILGQFLFAGFSSAAKKNSFLKPEDAFKVEVIKEGAAIVAKIKMAEKIHLYNDTLHYKITSPKKFELHPVLPKAVKLEDGYAYAGDLVVQIPLEEIESKVEGEYLFEIEFQGCSDSGICYQPIKKSFTFEGKGKVGFFSKISSLVKSGNSSSIADALANESWAFIILLFFVAGLLMALTPCILPMIPILSSIILQQGNKDGEVKKSTAFAISLVYVISMAFTYALIGVVAGLLDFDLQANMNNPWVIIPLALIFIALAASLFGYFELALPASWQAKLNNMSDKAYGKGLIGTAIMGSLSALIVGACTAPIISGAILFIMLTGKALLGGIALFFMGIGAGIPLLLVGAGASKFVPKPGGWMSMVSKFFGLLMLAMALIILSRLIPNEAATGERGYSIERLESELASTDKPVVIDIYKAGCAACKELEEITFPNTEVQKKLEKFTFIHIDVTEYTEEDKALLKKYQLFGAPNIIFFDKNDKHLPAKNLTGFVPPEEFAKHLESIAK